jgi:hypothetical protein
MNRITGVLHVDGRLLERTGGGDHLIASTDLDRGPRA